MKIVLDNNVFISGIFWKGSPCQIIKLAEERKIEITTSAKILKELFNVLQREKFKPFYEEGQTNFKKVFDKILELIKIYPSILKLEIIKEDPEDNKFLACALEAQASFLVSGDKHLLKLKKFHNIPILTPRQFLDYF